MLSNMENSLPLEAMKEIFQLRLAEMIELDKSGQASVNDYAELFNDAFVLTSKKYENLSESYQHAADLCIEYGNTIIRMQKEFSRERRIFHLFLQNHGLELEYENFEARILERIFSQQK